MGEKNKDWVGGKNSIYTCLGASNHVDEERELNDFYATAEEASEWLLKLEPELNDVWENAVGSGNLAEPFRRCGKLGAISDLVDRGYHPEGVLTSYGKDFLQMKKVWKGDIVTNPPYSSALLFVKKSLELIRQDRKVCMFLKTTFLEGKERKQFFLDNPPKVVYVSSSRIICAKNNEFLIPKKDKDGNVKFNKNGEPIMEKPSSAVSYSWFVWQKGYKGDTIVKWFN